MKHTKNIRVKTGEYTKGGKTVGKYLTVGKVLAGDDGREMILLDRTFNPAGCPNDGRDSIILNFWDVEERAETAEHKPATSAPASELLDDEIPF